MTCLLPVLFIHKMIFFFFQMCSCAQLTIHFSVPVQNSEKNKWNWNVFHLFIHTYIIMYIYIYLSVS